MDREAAYEKAKLAFQLLSEIHEERFTLRKEAYNQHHGWIIRYFATDDAKRMALRLMNFLGNASEPMGYDRRQVPKPIPPDHEQLTLSAIIGGADRLGG